MKTPFLSLALVVASLRLVAAGSSQDYVAHEWGTFTSVQGADGILLEWNPLETTRLPSFVYNWSKPGLNRRHVSSWGKSTFLTLQRMETPVIYFYGEKEQTVDVTVRFPQGLITEWYPQARDIGPSVFPQNQLGVTLDGMVKHSGATLPVSFASMLTKQGIPDSRIHWSNIRITPATQHEDIVRDLPTDSVGNHYFAARETDSAFVQVESLDKASPGPEHERFLFYRGVANFKAPLQVTVTSGSGSDIDLRNTGPGELRHLFVLAVRRGQGKFIYEDRVPQGEHVNVELKPGKDLLALKELTTRISERMRESLTAEGLFEREAAAMVKTWRQSWFEEDGVRVFYVLPRPWTDGILPLTLDPKPRELVRVMVGRAEIITPAAEWELLKQIVRYSENDSQSRREAVAGVRELGLGRFIQPAVQRVLGRTPDREFSRTAWELVNAATPKPGDEHPLAAK